MEQPIDKLREQLFALSQGIEKLAVTENVLFNEVQASQVFKDWTTCRTRLHEFMRERDDLKVTIETLTKNL